MTQIPSGLKPDVLDIISKNSQIDILDLVEEQVKISLLSGKDETDRTDLLQYCIENIPAGRHVKITGGVWRVSKNKGYRPDIYGDDNRTVSKNGVTLTLDGMQPCISIIEKEGSTFDFTGSTFIVDKLGQDFLHVIRNSDNVTILHTGKIRTKPYLDIGYIGGKNGLFPPIDGTKGFAAKGYSKAGFNTTTYTVELSSYRNNSIHTQDISKNGGGYDGNYPQDDGSVSTTWGEWRGWKIPNVGSGVLVAGCRNVRIHNFDIRGFVGDCLEFGWLGKLDGTQLNGNQVKEAEEAGVIAHDCYVLGGTGGHNYIGGINGSRYNGLYVDSVIIDGVGHPDHSLSHSVDGKGVTIDPGYGLHTSRYLSQKELVVNKCKFTNCARKIIDAHTGNDVTISNNTGSATYYAIGTVIEELYAMDDISYPTRVQTHRYLNNRFYSGLYGIFPKNGSFGYGIKKKEGKFWLECDYIIEGNTINAPLAFSYNYGHSRMRIVGNFFNFYFKEPWVNMNTSTIIAFYHGAINNRGPTFGDIIRDNYVRNSPFGNYATGFVFNDISASTIEDNMVDTTPYAKGTPIVPEKVSHVNNLPYISANPVRPRIETNAFIIAGKISDTTFSNNRSVNKQTGNVKYWDLIKDKPITTPITNDTKEEEIQQVPIADSVITNTVLTDYVYYSTSNKDYGDTDLVHGVDKDNKSIGKAISSTEKRRAPSDYTFVKKDNEIEWMRSALLSSSASAGVLVETEYTHDGYLYFSLWTKIEQLSSYGTGTLISAGGSFNGKKTSGGITLGYGDPATKDRKKFIMRSNGSSLFVDGVEYTPDTVLSGDTIYHIAGKIRSTGSKLLLGGPASYNVLIPALYNDIIFQKEELTKEQIVELFNTQKSKYGK